MCLGKLDAVDGDAFHSIGSSFYQGLDRMVIFDTNARNRKTRIAI